MNQKSHYNRILLKLSGETLKGDQEHGYNIESCQLVVDRIKQFIDNGVEVAIVVGAGNLWRGAIGAAGGMDRVNADKMGMLATVMNAIALREFFNESGISVLIQSAIPMGTFVPLYDREDSIRALEAGKVVIFAGGTVNPYFTTDTASVLRALETDCDAVFKATQVDGIYTADPHKNSDAIRYETISFDEAVDKRLKVMDATAFSLCRDHELPIVVFNFFDADLDALLAGDTSAGTIVGL